MKKYLIMLVVVSNLVCATISTAQYYNPNPVMGYYPVTPQYQMEYNTPTAPTQGVNSAEATYRSAYTFYKSGNLVAAESGMLQVLGQCGNCDLADNAYYWLGKIKLRSGNNNLAYMYFRQAANYRNPQTGESGNKSDAAYTELRILEEVAKKGNATSKFAEKIMYAVGMTGGQLMDAKIDNTMKTAEAYGDLARATSQIEREAAARRIAELYNANAKLHGKGGRTIEELIKHILK